MKAGAKAAVLKYIAKKCCLNFIEIDIKSCHTVVFRAFSDNSDQLVPPTKHHWASLTKNFIDRANELKIMATDTEKDILIEVLKWDYEQCKGLIKTQWYKALNGGSCFNPTDNLEKGKFKLNISTADLPLYIPVIKKIFEGMPVFKKLKGLQIKLHKQDYIFLPTDTEPFYTKTLSNSQTKDNKTSNVSMTAMSRLFTNCEMAIIVMLYITLGNFKYPVFPISYEADGLLLVGEFEKEDLPDMIKQINEEVTVLVKRLYQEDYEFEFKNATCD